MKFLPKKFIKVCLFIFTFYFLFFTFSKSIKASPAVPTETEPQQFPATVPIETKIQQFQANWYNNVNQIYWEKNIFGGSDKDLNADMYSLYTSKNKVINEVIYFLGGPITEEGIKKSGGNFGAVPITTNLIASLINTPPVSTGEYLADLGSSLGLAKPAYAQEGTGFKALKPVMQIWKAFRNISYMAFVIIFVILGFMIMFRTKINPQTVVSIQEALPQIVITLLLITFSYAIASLMIDLIYVVIYLAIAVFNTGDLFADGGQKALDRIFSLNIWGMVYEGRNVFIANPAKAVKEVIDAVGSGGVIVQGLTNAVLWVIIFMSLFKLFISLLTSYVQIILSVIFAPFSLLLNVFPGSNSFTAWIRNLLANVAVFPVVTIMFVLAAILVGPAGENPWGVNEQVGYGYGAESGESGWTPPFLTAVTPRPLQGFRGEGTLPSSDVVLALIGVGIILLIPHTVDLVKKTLKIEASPLAVILGAAPSAVMGAPGKAVMSGAQFLYQAHYAQQTLADITSGFKGLAEKIRGPKGVSQPADTGGRPG